MNKYKEKQAKIEEQDKKIEAEEKQEAQAKI